MKKRTWKSKRMLQSGFLLLLAFFIFHIYLLAARQGEINRVVSDTGAVQAGAQRYVAFVLSGEETEAVLNDLNSKIKDLLADSSALIKRGITDKLEQLLYELSNVWNQLKDLAGKFETGEEQLQKLLTLSERHYKLAQNLNLETEQYSAGVMIQLQIFEALLVLLLVCGAGVGLRQYLVATQLEQKNRELKVAAYLDELTGIPGRRGCDERLCATEKQNVERCAVMFDLNNLKKVNDRMGHRTGDELIKAFAGILNQFVEERIFVGRYGGDEFLMITEGFQEAEIQELLGRIESRVKEYNRCRKTFQIDYACGYGFCTESMALATERADQNMYLNKRKMKERNGVFLVANPEK